MKKITSKHKFYRHLATNTFWGCLFICLALLLGMWGYHKFEQMSWIDAFVNAAMILSGMGPLTPLATNAGKIFAGFYALFSGLSFIIVIGLIFAPVIHMFFRKIHLELHGDPKD